MSTATPTTRYPDFDTLSRELAARIAALLKAAIAARGQASLLVSGGKSPIKLFEYLRSQTLDWSRVSIALVDERWVDPTDPASNEKLVRDHLLQGPAAAARFAGLKNPAPTPELGALTAWEGFSRLPRPFDLVILGMGDDGHTASLFPDSPHLAQAIDPAAAPACIGMHAPTAPHQRLSLNLTALLDARGVVVLLSGAAKWQVFLTASEPGAVEEMPIRAVLRQSGTPVEVVWAP